MIQSVYIQTNLIILFNTNNIADESNIADTLRQSKSLSRTWDLQRSNV